MPTPEIMEVKDHAGNVVSPGMCDCSTCGEFCEYEIVDDKKLCCDCGSIAKQKIERNNYENKSIKGKK